MRVCDRRRSQFLKSISLYLPPYRSEEMRFLQNTARTLQ